MAYTYASNLNGTYETILESVQQIFSADADLFTGFSSNPSYLFADNLRQTMHNYAEFLEGALWLYGAVIVGNDLSEIEAVSLPLSTQDANYLSTRTNGFDTAINYLTTNLKMQPAPLANLTTSGPLIGDPGFETYFSQLNAEVVSSNLLSVQEGTLTDFANAPLSGATLTWVSPNFGTLPFGTGNGIAQVFQLPPEFTFPSIVPVAGIYKSDWQGNQLQYPTPRTNLLSNSNNFTAGTWVNSNCTLAAGAATGPDGVAGSATKLAVATTSNPNISNNDYTVPATPPAQISTSFWVKSGNISQAIINSYQNGVGGIAANYFILSGPGSISGNGTAIGSITGLSTTQWTRVGYTTTGALTAGYQFNLYIKPQTGSPVIGDYIYISAANLETAPKNTSYILTTGSPVTVTDYSLSGSTLTFSIAPISNSSLTWQDASSNIFNFGVGNGSTTVYNLGVEYNPGPSIYKSDWQGNQLQYSTPRTNLIDASNNFTASTWENSNCTVTASSTTGPDGVSGSATKLAVANVSNPNIQNYSYTVPATPPASLSAEVWIKAGNITQCVLDSFQNSVGGVPANFSILSGPGSVSGSGTSIGTVTGLSPTQWTRVGFTTTGALTAGVSYNFYIKPQAATITLGDYVYIFGSQLEIGSVNTSYIPTTTAPVTVTDYSLESSLGVYGISQDETNGWARIRAALLVSGASYPPNLADTLTFMQNIQQKVTNYGVTYAPTLSNNFPVSAIWNYAICVWTYQDMAAIYSNLPDSQVIQNIQILRYVLKQVELQCAELLTAYRTQAQIPPNTSPLLQSDSLMDLANRALGDYTQWVNIATANGLLPPYTYPTPAPNIASPGTQLFMPGSSTPTNLGNYLLNFLGTDLNWGIPLQSMPVWTGDFETVVGYTNLRWALARRILTPLNSLIYHPEYGSYLSQYLGQPLTNLNLQLILSYTSIALLNDPRIASIVNLTPALTEVNTLLIQASVQPLGIGVTPTQINLTLQPSAISVT